MANSQAKTNQETNGNRIAANEQSQGMDGDLLIKAFKHLFPCLTKSLVAEDYVDDLLANDLLDFETVKDIQSKATPKERSRELLVQICQKKGACKVILDLLMDQTVLHGKIMSEYNILAKRSLKEKVADTTGGLKKLQIKDEPTPREESTTAQQKFRVSFEEVCVSEHPRSGKPSVNDICAHLKKQQRLKDALECFVHDFDPKYGDSLRFVSLKMPKIANNDFEWEELSPLLTGLSSGELHGFIQEIQIKAFVSEGEKKEVTRQLIEQKDSGANSTKKGKGKGKDGKSQTLSDTTTNGSEFPSRENDENKKDYENQSSASTDEASGGVLAKTDSQNDGRARVTPAVPSDLLPILRQVRFGVGKESRKRASEVMNSVARSVVNSLKEQYRLVLRPEFSGSSFEGAKIEAANEFDMLIILNGKDLDRVEYNPQFFYLRPRKEDNPVFKEFLSNSGNIDPDKITSTLFSWVQLALNSLFPVGSQYIVKVRRTGPAVTLLIEANPKYPNYEKDLGKLDVDLVATFEVLKEQFVAKPYQSPNPENESSMDNIRHLWRKSFSLLEKERLTCIDKDGGCRRQSLRLLKFIRLRESTFKRLASYHYKVLLLNECNKFQNREDWVADKLAERFWGLLSSLRDCLEDGSLPHCIDNRINIFERIKPIVLNNMKGRVTKILNKGSVELKKIFDKEQIS